MNIIKSSVPAMIFISLAALFAYFGLQESFFEQDEWHSFGYYNYLFSLNGLEFIQTILKSGPLSHFTPLSLFFKMWLYQLFGLNASAYFFVSIFLHVIVSLTVYFLALQLLKRRLPAFLGGLFFALNSSHYQTVTWLGTFEGAELSTLFGLLSLLVVLVFLDRKKKVIFHERQPQPFEAGDEARYLRSGKEDIRTFKSGRFIFNLSLFLILIALLFKETALVFILSIVILIILKERGANIIKALLKLGTVSLFYIMLRFSYLIFGSRGSDAAVGLSTGKMLLIAGYNILSLPVKIFSQILLPNELMVNITNQATTPDNLYQRLGRGPWVLENALRYDLLMIPFGLAIWLILFVIGKKLNPKLPFYLGLMIIIFTLLPFLILRRYLVYFDSRYLYTATVGFSLIIGSVFTYFVNNKRDLQRSFLKVGTFLVILAIIFTSHLVTLKNTINAHMNIGNLRKQILNKVTSENPNLPERVVFYTESDTTYYRLSDKENILPFQSGFGQTLLVYYQQSEQYPEEFFEDFFLWEIDEQGYREVGSRGFGYYRNFDLLKKAVKQYNIPTSSVVAYAWVDKDRNLINISRETKARLEER